MRKKLRRAIAIIAVQVLVFLVSGTPLATANTGSWNSAGVLELAEIDKISVGVSPLFMALNPDGSQLYVVILLLCPA